MANHKNHADQRSAAEMDAAQRELAYHMWERDGRPEGRSDFYWQQAGEELDRGDDIATIAAPRRRAAKSADVAGTAAKAAPSRVKAAAGKSPAEKPAAAKAASGPGPNGAAGPKAVSAKAAATKAAAARASATRTAAAKAVPSASKTAEPAGKTRPGGNAKPKG